MDQQWGCSMVFFTAPQESIGEIREKLIEILELPTMPKRSELGDVNLGNEVWSIDAYVEEFPEIGLDDDDIAGAQWCVAYTTEDTHITEPVDLLQAAFPDYTFRWADGGIATA